MKKFLIFLVVFFGIVNSGYAKNISYDTFVTDDDVTTERLDNNFNIMINNLNAIPGENLVAGTVSADALTDNANPEKRWADTFSNFVVTGLLAPAGASLTATTTAGRALITNTSNVEMIYVQKDATAKTYTAGVHTYVDLSSAGTYTYSEVSQGAAEPATTSNSIRLFLVSADNTSGVGAVTDKRVIGASIGSAEDFYISGMEMTAVSPDNMVTVDTGVVYHGATRLEKTAQTGLRHKVAANWWDGNADTYSSAGFNYVGVDSSGSIKFIGANPPDKADTDENTAGILRYWDDGTKLWRVLGATYINSSNNIELGQTQVNDTILYNNIATEVVDPTGNPTVILDQGTSTSFADITVTYIPTFTKIYPILQGFSTGSESQSLVRRNGDISYGTFVFNEVGGGGTGFYEFIVPVDSSRIFEYKKLGGTNITFWVYGYKYTR